MANIPRLVIGCEDPVPERAARGAGALHAAGVSVTMGVLREDCAALISEYAQLANSKARRGARQHAARTGRVRRPPPREGGWFAPAAPAHLAVLALFLSARHSPWDTSTAASSTATMSRPSPS